MPLPNNPNPQKPWPEIQEGYEDEFGPVDPEVYKLAGTVWPLAQAHILRTINDYDTGQRLLVKAVVIVSRKCAEKPDQITNVKAYLIKTFYHLLLEELEKRSKHDQLETEVVDSIQSIATRSDADIERTILLHEIRQRADKWTREVLSDLVLGYKFEELADKYGMKANRLRSTWSKKLRRLEQQIGKETRAAQENILRSRRKGF
jgi:DNA-directed RNA polymerase specialized sigma24 family protein